MLDRTVLSPHIVISTQDLQNTPLAILNLPGYPSGDRTAGDRDGRDSLCSLQGDLFLLREDEQRSDPPEHRTGYGPRLCALIAEMAGTQADSRSTIHTFCYSVLGLKISLGTIQKSLDRVSQAIEP